METQSGPDTDGPLAAQRLSLPMAGLMGRPHAPRFVARYLAVPFLFFFSWSCHIPSVPYCTVLYIQCATCQVFYPLPPQQPRCAHF